jgi:hypothetical protein
MWHRGQMILRVVVALGLTVMLTMDAAWGAEPPTPRSLDLRAMPLPRRCELARLVAHQAAFMIIYTSHREAYLAGGHGGLLVWVGEPEGDVEHGDAEAENGKLIRASEACEPVLFSGPTGGTRIEIVGKGIPEVPAGPANCLAFVAREHDGNLTLVMRLNRPESCAAPLPPTDGGVTMRHGRAMMLVSSPELEIDVAVRKDGFRIERAALTFVPVGRP